ncbi:Ca2-binding protein [Aureococcus anophagefferens]|nr:Ca2-binding protein [Aureococcus anophagefferens]
MQSLWNKSKQLAQAGSDVVSAGVSAGTDALAKSTGAATSAVATAAAEQTTQAAASAAASVVGESAAAALFGGGGARDEVALAPATLALGAWRDARASHGASRCPAAGAPRASRRSSPPARASRARRPRGATRSGASSSRRGLGAPARPSGPLRRAAALRPGEAFVAPVACGYAAARRGAAGYDVALAGVGAEGLAWHAYRCGADAATERAALAVAEGCAPDRATSVATWIALAAAPGRRRRGAGCVRAVLHAAARLTTAEAGTCRDDAFCRRYAGAADRPSSGFAAGASVLGSILSTVTKTALFLDPAACLARSATLDYLRSLEVLPQVFEWTEEIKRLSENDRQLVEEIAHELGFPIDDEALAPAYFVGADRDVVDAAPGLAALRDAHLAWRMLVGPTLAEAIAPPPKKKKLWRPGQLAQVWTGTKGSISVKTSSGAALDPSKLSKNSGWFGGIFSRNTLASPPSRLPIRRSCAARS